MGVDFGYELVDADWKLHFPPAEETRTASVAKPSPEPPAPVAKKTALSGPVSLMPPATGGQPSGQPSPGPFALGPIQGGLRAVVRALGGNAGQASAAANRPPGRLHSTDPGRGTGRRSGVGGNAGPDLGGPGLAGPAGTGGSDGPQIGMTLPPPSGSPGGSGTGTWAPASAYRPRSRHRNRRPTRAPAADQRPVVGLSRPRPYGAPADGVALPGIGGANGRRSTRRTPTRRFPCSGRRMPPLRPVRRDLGDGGGTEDG
ncbi:MAG: hypothetical protein U0736_18560 [Gemmataceae bacterium]